MKRIYRQYTCYSDYEMDSIDESKIIKRHCTDTDQIEMFIAEGNMSDGSTTYSRIQKNGSVMFISYNDSCMYCQSRSNGHFVMWHI